MVCIMTSLKRIQKIPIKSKQDCNKIQGKMYLGQMGCDSLQLSTMTWNALTELCGKGHFSEYIQLGLNDETLLAETQAHGLNAVDQLQYKSTESILLCAQNVINVHPRSVFCVDLYEFISKPLLK